MGQCKLGVLKGELEFLLVAPVDVRKLAMIAGTAATGGATLNMFHIAA